MPDPAPPAAPTRWYPWRSAALGWGVTGAVLVAAVPLFVCMPPWCDLTLYEVAARTILRGGVHYRDVFDTNPPGFPLLLTAVRFAFGPSLEVVHAVDLLVVAGGVAVLARFARTAGGTRAAVAWFAAGVALFYPFTTEFSHCQRDAWMLLPAVGAAWVRVRQLLRLTDSGTDLAPASGRGRSLLPAFGEGCLWGVAVWIKPHVVVPAVGVWAATALLVPWRQGVRDLGGMLLGVAVLGLAGLGWLVGSGSWPYFLDIFTNWNPEYARAALAGTPDRVVKTFEYFPPWSLAHVAAVPVALAGLYEAARHAAGRPPHRGAERFYAAARTPRELVARATLAAFYLGWLGQALVLQHAFPYIHVPETILALAVLAGQGWGTACAVLVWLLAPLPLVLTIPGVSEDVKEFNKTAPAFEFTRHQLTKPQFFGYWARCWTEAGTPQLRDDLGRLDSSYSGTRWVDLARVEAFLRAADPPPRDREVLCWNDTTHPLYLALGIEPPVRYMHFLIATKFESHRDQIFRDVAAHPGRYVVSDLMGVAADPTDADRPYDVDAPALDGRTDALPYWFPRSQLGLYPWNQPVVFRAGRYVVHRVDTPAAPERIARPFYADAAELGPGVNSWVGDVPAGAKRPPGGTPGRPVVVVRDPAAFADVCERLKFTPEPRIDFGRFLVCVMVTRTRADGIVGVVENGNLRVGPSWIGPAGDTFRYYILAYPRDGVRTVDGYPVTP